VHDFLGCFIQGLREPGDVRQNLLSAANAIVAEPSAELSRILRATSVDLPGAIRAAPDGWRPDADNPGRLADIVLLSAVSFTRELGVPGHSSASLAHALLRSHAEAVGQIRLAVRGYQTLPPLGNFGLWLAHRRR
jgi:hypothetical protein